MGREFKQIFLESAVVLLQALHMLHPFFVAAAEQVGEHELFLRRVMGSGGGSWAWAWRLLLHWFDSLAALFRQFVLDQVAGRFIRQSIPESQGPRTRGLRFAILIEGNETGPVGPARSALKR